MEGELSESFGKILRNRSLFGEEGRAFWGDHWIFRSTEGRSVVTERRKRGDH